MGVTLTNTQRAEKSWDLYNRIEGVIGKGLCEREQRKEGIPSIHPSIHPPFDLYRGIIEPSGYHSEGGRGRGIGWGKRPEIRFLNLEAKDSSISCWDPTGDKSTVSLVLVRRSIGSVISLQLQDNEGSESMICFCTYAGGSVSSPINPKQQEGSKSCRSCGAKLPVDKQGALSGIMLSTAGLELSGVINPHLYWKTTSKGRHRAVRRARRTFAASNEKNSALSGCEDLTSKESRRTSEMAISESEKLGVTILGCRFSENLESVPIKKRKLLLVRSPSPPPQLSHHSDDSADIEESQSSLCDGDASNKKRPDLSLGNSGNRTKLYQVISADGQKTDSQELDEKLCNTVDFSGISILATAACESNMGCNAMYTGGSASREHFSQVEKEICRMEDVDVKTYLVAEAPPLSLLPITKSDGNKLDCSIIPSKSDSSLNNLPAKTSGVELSSRDDRLHWDLNKVMDAWETCSDEALDCEPLGTNVIGADDSHCTNLGNVEPHKYQMVTCDIRCSPEVVDNSDLGAELEEDHVRKEAIVEEKPAVFGGSSVTHENQKQDSSLLHGSGLNQEGHALEDASVPIVNAVESTKPVCSRRKSSVTAGLVSSPVGGLVSYRDSSLIAAAPKEEITRVICTEADACPSLLVPCQKAGSGVTSADKPLSAQDQDANFLYEKKMVEGSAADFYGHSAAAHLVENESETMVDGDTCNDMIKADGIAGGSTCLNAFNKTECGSTDKLIGEKLSSLPPDSHAIDSHGLTNYNVLCYGDACARGHETTGSCMKMSDRCSVMADGNLNATIVHSSPHIDSDSPEHNSADVKDGVLDASSLEEPLNSHGTVTGDLHGNTTSSVQMGLHGHSDSDYYSDVSQSDIDQAVGMERIEFLGDEDYQYEDGEFRESSVKCWAEYGADEGETEHLDYWSDSREMDNADDYSDIPPDGVRTGRLSDVGQDYKSGALVGKETQLAVSQSLMTCSFLKDVSDTGFARKGIKDGEKLEGDVKDTSESLSVNNIVRRDGEFINEGDDSRNLSQGMKLPGWDQLPEGSKGFVGAVVDSGVSAICHNLIDPSFGASFSTRSSLGRDLLSQTERLESSNVLRRKDKSARRCDDLSDFDPRAQRDMGARPIGRGGSSMHVHGGGKQDAWVDSASQRGSNNHDSRVWCDPNNMTRPVPRNAAEATVARLKNNGYVVSSNGTIIKAGSMGPAGNEPRRAAISSSHSANHSFVKRRSSVERDGAFSMQLGLNCSREESPNRLLSSSQDRGVSSGRYAARMVSTSQKDRYYEPMTDNNRNMPLSPRHGLSRREQSLSPCRRPLHQSRSRSRTRSGTRSPRFCTSQRGRTDRVKKGSGLQTHSRSPNFRHEGRIQRSRSPQQRSGLVEHMIGYAPLSRNQSSLPNASRWLGERKGFSHHFRQNEKNRLPDRGFPRRVLSRNHRISAGDTPGQDKSEEFYRPMHSENFDEFVDFGGGSRYAGVDSERRGYEMLRPMRQCATKGNMKRFPAEVQEGFRANHPQSRTPGFRQRGVLRVFKGGEESHLEDSRRSKEEKGNVRYGRDKRHNAGIKSFGDRDSAIEGTLQRTS